MSPDIRNQELAQITDFLKKHGEQSFRARQIFEWLWKKNATSFDQMSNLSLSLRDKLNQEYIIKGLRPGSEQISTDTTRKYGFMTFDDLMVEGVLIPSANRITACISSQIGCPLNCSFCATARLKKRRNILN